jgi:hypothetical protein
MLNYVLPIAASLIALLQLAKDWGAHQTSWRRGAALALIGLFGIGSAINNYYASQKVTSQHASDQAEIKGLKTAVETANKNQEANTTQFVAAFAKLSKDVGDLQTQVASEKLQTKLAGVQDELQKTQRALGPGPKAALTFRFLPFQNAPLGQQAVPVTSKAFSPNLDGSVHVEFTVLNLTPVDALDGDLTLTICYDCKFAKEPTLFTKLDENSDKERTMHFAQILAKTAFVTLSADIVAAPYLLDYGFGLNYRCRTCILPKDGQGITGTVHILR